MNNFYLSCKECVLEGPRSFYGCFYLGPFNNSQSLTIANALRRTLLSEISGLGILNAQIEGVEHEYSTFLGIRESVLDLLLNLKEVVFCYSSDFEILNTIQDNKGQPEKKIFSSTVPASKNFNNQKTGGIFMGYLQVTGPGIVRASDFKLPSFLQCVDPDQYIATLSENGKLNLKIEIFEKNFLNHTKNRNFQSSLNKKKILTDLPLFDPQRGRSARKGQTQVSSPALPVTPLRGVRGRPLISQREWGVSRGASSEKLHTPDAKTLKVDSVFSPIKKVNYTIEHYGTFVAGVQFQNHRFLAPSNPPKGGNAPSAHKGGKHLEKINPNNQVIFLELWTNGSIHPRVALYEALNILNSTFSKLEKMKILNDVYIKSIFKSNQNYSKIVQKTLSNLITLPSVSSLDKQVGFNLNQSKENSNYMAVQHFSKNQLIEFDKNLTFSSFDKLKLIYLDKKEKNLINEFHSIKILNLPFRIENCLIQANIITLSDLFNKTLNDFKQIPGLGKQSFSFLQKKLFVFLYNCSSTNPTA